VPRWVTIPVLRKQSVAEHSFLVALWSDRIATVIGWDASPGHWLMLNRWALSHDLPEAFTGDTPSPFKRAYNNDNAEGQFSREWHPEYNDLKQRLNAGDSKCRDVLTIVSFADLLEAAIFLREESLVGNQMVGEYRLELNLKTTLAWFNLPWPDQTPVEVKQSVWLNEVLPLIA
jgi:5'-deoxynucleotidase YfbR-like HD superfamily hydrolase